VQPDSQPERKFDFNEFLGAKRFRVDIAVRNRESLFMDVKLSGTHKAHEMVKSGKCGKE